jgi:hypothetical protein
VSFVPDPEWEDEEDDATDPATLYVDITEPSVVAVLYDTKGEPLIELLDRDTVDFGYQRSDRDDDR